MFEEQTYEAILRRMMAAAVEGRPEVDTRTASILFSALAPAAVELTNLYITADSVLDEAFADTQSRDFLIRRCAERGMHPYPATAAVWRGQFNKTPPVGTRFSLEGLNYVLTESISETDARLECETPGEAGNTLSGRLIPIEYVVGLTKAQLVELLIPGEDEEDTEHLRERYLTSFRSQAFGGNVQDYLDKVGAIAGVGGCKVYPVWNGGGSVRVVVIDSTFAPPKQTLIDAVQEALDPKGSSGQGYGVAPIGHTVTVDGVTAARIDVKTSLTLREGWAFEDVRPYAEQAVDAYFQELAKQWAGSDALVVRVSQIETRLLELDGVIDVGDTALDGVQGNKTLGVDEIPVRGDVVG
jgi:uncharacterized phage protein gp47/JayE